MISHHIEASKHEVRLWCSRRLPFEPDAEMKEVRNRLSASIRKLDPSSGGVLHARFWSEDPSTFDVENVLFYNVGLSAFSALARTGLSFARVRQRPSASPAGGSMAHLHEYSVGTASSTLFPSAGDTRTLEFVIPPDVTKLSATAVWWHARERGGWHGKALTGRYALRIQLSGRPQERSLVASIKPLIDGIVASMHSDPFPDPEAVVRIANDRRSTAQEVARRLQAPNPILGPRTLVRPFRDGTKWDPADEWCEAVAVETRPAPNRDLVVAVTAALL